MGLRQHICSFDCGKAFSRKEHLARHEKTHDPQNLLLGKGIQPKVCIYPFKNPTYIQNTASTSKWTILI
ncbi:hypothetical protein BUE80_DR005966 [Diplocarpon rosae]|nr:hypothetical protein BUE80_DR005966 [Diplocarpon rosae]